MIYRERSWLDMTKLDIDTSLMEKLYNVISKPYNLEKSKEYFEFYLGTLVQENYQDKYVFELIKDYKIRNSKK